MIGTQRQRKLQEAWINPKAFASTLLTLFNDMYRGGVHDHDETAPFEWDPHTILYHIEEDFNIAMPPANFDRLMAAITIVTTDYFYKSCPDFITLCNVLCGDTFDPRTWDPADAGEIAWGITEAMIIYPPDEDDDEPFTPEITAYIGAILDAEGIIHPPDVLRIATDRQQFAGSVPDTYTDDPVMFGAISDFEDQKTSAIQEILRENIHALANQIADLPLREGDGKGAVKKMFGDFARTA